VRISWDQFDFVVPKLSGDPSKRNDAANDSDPAKQQNAKDDSHVLDQPYEETCKWLERAFSESHACKCCAEANQKDRCPWCYEATGWHRCLKYCEDHRCALDDPAAFRWKENSLFNINNTDAERVVIVMIKFCKPLKKMKRFLMTK